MTIYYDKDGVVIRDAQRDDLAQITALRKPDMDEIWASFHFTPQEALLYSYGASTKKLTVLFKGGVVAMFGIVPDSLLGKQAIVWMLTTELINEMKIRFAKLSKRFIAILRESYPILYNFVDVRHRQCVQWLSWCGATVFPPTAFGMDNKPFHYFVFGED